MIIVMWMLTACRYAGVVGRSQNPFDRGAYSLGSRHHIIPYPSNKAAEYRCSYLLQMLQYLQDYPRLKVIGTVVVRHYTIVLFRFPIYIHFVNIHTMHGNVETIFLVNDSHTWENTYSYKRRTHRH